MNNLPPSQETMVKILKNGTYYFPATKHYNNNATSVMCDRCRRTDLDMCIGLDSYDLCLPCIQDISHIYKPITVTPPPVFHGPIMTMMLQEQFNPRGDGVKTYMKQEQFNPGFSVCTNMMQGSCRKY